MLFDALEITYEAERHGIETEGRTPGEVVRRINGEIERENQRWRLTAWQTAWMLNAWGDGKKTITPEDLLGIGKKTGSDAMPEPGTKAFEDWKEEYRERVEEYKKLCAESDARYLRNEVNNGS